MSDIASSLEQEFADHSQAERASHIAELKQIESKGHGSVAVAPHAIMSPLLFGFVGAMMAWASIANQRLSVGTVVAFIVGVVFVAASAWGIFGPRKPRFTLCEEGVRVKDALLPWSSIEDYGVTENSYNGFTTHTSIVFQLAAGFTPPELGLFFVCGANTRNRKTGQYSTRLTLHAGAKGMNVDKLAERIGEFFAAARARAELARLNAD